MAYDHEMIHIQAGMLVKIFDFQARNLDRYVPKHWHQSAEILFCFSGSLNVWITSKLYVMHKGDIIVINSNVVHATQSLEKNHILVIQVPYTFLESVTLGEYYSKFQFNVNTVSQSQNHYLVMQENLRMLISLTNQFSLSDKEITSNLEKMSIFYAILKTMYGSHREKIQDSSFIENQSKKLEKLSEITSYINYKYAEEISLLSVAKNFNYSSGYFSRFFRKYMGMSFTEYLRSIRLDDAYDQVIHSHTDVSTIALKSGFGDYRNLYNAFYAIYHCSPLQYRRDRMKRV